MPFKSAKKEKVKVVPAQNFDGFVIESTSGAQLLTLSSPSDDNKFAKKLANQLKKEHNDSLVA